jgi:predicted transcriptional regulator
MIVCNQSFYLQQGGIFMKTKEPFVVVWKHELTADLTPAEFKVYITIKSFASNGRAKVPLSFREIENRCSLSFVYVRTLVLRLISKGWLRKTGEKSSRVGGLTDVYQVLTEANTQVLTPSNTTEKKVLATDYESVNKNVSEVLQSKKEYKKNNNGDHFSQNEQDRIWKILGEESDKEIARQRRAGR